MSGIEANITDVWTLLVIAGLAVITAVSRSFFFLSNREWHLPHWAQRGLQYAPIAALSAVVVPEIVEPRPAHRHLARRPHFCGSGGRGGVLCQTQCVAHHRVWHGRLFALALRARLVIPSLEME